MVSRYLKFDDKKQYLGEIVLILVTNTQTHTTVQ